MNKPQYNMFCLPPAGVARVFIIHGKSRSLTIFVLFLLNIRVMV